MEYSRTKLREKIMIILYQIYVYKKDNIKCDIKEIIKNNIEIKSKFVEEIVYGVLEKEEILDKNINKYMKDWEIKRLGILDQAIFRMSTFELLFYNTPNIVVINEAINLSKKYSDIKVSKMLNGVLDKIYEKEA